MPRRSYKAKKTAPTPRRAPSPSPAGSRARAVRVLLVLGVLLLAVQTAYLLLGNGGGGEVPVRILWRVQGSQTPSGTLQCWDVASLGDGRLVVADQPRGQLAFFREDGTFLNRIGSVGEGPLQFKEPSGLTSDGRGTVFVMDTWNGAVKGFDPGGGLVLNLDLTRFKTFYGPRGLDYDGKDFWIADTGGHRIVRFSRSGEILQTFGSHGKGRGEFFNPLAVSVTPSGDRYCVADSDNRRVQCFDFAGRHLKTLDFEHRVFDVALGADGVLYVTFLGADQVAVVDGKYRKRGFLTVPGSQGNPFVGLIGVDVLPDGRVVLAGGDTIVMVQPLPER